MAVKQKVVECLTSSSAETRLQIILRFLQEIPNQDGLKDKMCANIVQGLGMLQVPSEPEKYVQFVSDIKSIQTILSKECSNRHLILATLEAFYKEISDPDKNPSPAMSIVLQLISPENIPVAVRWILHSSCSEHGLEQALLTLCVWLSKGTWADNLGPLVLALIEGLEHEQHYEILVDVTVSTIEPLFKLVILPESRKNVGPVVLCMLSRLQDRPNAFHKIIPHVGTVISYLYKEKSESSEIFIQQIVSLCLALMEIFPNYPALYEPLKSVLKPYYGSADYKQILNCPSWPTSYNVFRKHQCKIGLNNLGNTCYMNSVLQALFMTKIFRNEVLLNINQDTSLLLKLQELFALLQFSHKPSLSPSNILNLARPPGFVQGHQHDSSEFLCYLLDVLHEQEKNAKAAESQSSASGQVDTTIIQQSFGGRTVTVFRCGDCGTASERIDSFRELQLSFPNNIENQSVQTLLEYYLQPEILHGDNQYQCDVCQHLVDGERATKIVEAPKRLVLTLKYFCYDPASQQRTKLSAKVKLNDYIKLDTMHYALYAVVVHSGCSVDSGHYYTFAKDDEEWYKFNDSFVSKTSPDEICRLIPPATPYILFYRWQDSSDPLPLEKTSLPSRLQSYLLKENSEYASEKQTLIMKSNNYNFDDDDEPPPPNCGGNSFSSSSSNMFVF